MSSQTSVQIHGLLLTIAFGVVLPISAIVARYYKTQKNSVWLTLHVSLIFISFVLLVAGVAILDPNSEALYSTHGLLGIVLVIGVFVQIALGIKSARVKCEDLKKETTFETGHKNLANLLVGGGAVNIILGFEILKNDVYIVGGYIAWLALLVLFVIYLEWKRGRASRYNSSSLFKSKSGLTFEKQNNFKDGKSPFMYRPSWNKLGGKNDSLIAEALVRSRNGSVGPQPLRVNVVTPGGPPVPKSRKSSATKPSPLGDTSPLSPAMLSERISVLDRLTQKLLDSRKGSSSSISALPEVSSASSKILQETSVTRSRSVSPVPRMTEIDINSNDGEMKKNAYLSRNDG